MRVVCASNRETDEGPGQKGRHHDGDIGKVRASKERIVEHHRIPRRPGELAHHVAKGVGHAPKVHRDMGGLGEERPPGIKKGAGVIKPILDIRRQRRAPKHHAHLFTEGASAMRQERQRDSVHELSRIPPFTSRNGP